jgi:hypothetical protein
MTILEKLKRLVKINSSLAANYSISALKQRANSTDTKDNIPITKINTIISTKLRQYTR